MKIFALLILLALVSSTSHARIYKWTNAQGETVYGENPPAEVKRDNIKRIETTNTESKAKQAASEATDSGEEKKLTPDEEFEKHRLALEKYKTEMVVFCSKIRKRLAFLQSVGDEGYVVKDANGKDLSVDNAKRLNEITNAKQQIAQHCQ